MKTSIFSLIIAVLVLILSLFQYERYQKLAATTHHEIQEATEASKTQLTDMRAEIDKIAQFEHEIQKNEHTPAWVLSEIEYLMHLASLKLKERDINTAIILLGSANEKIQSLNDMSFRSLQEAILSDREALRVVNLPNVEDVWFKVKNLALEAQNLPIRGMPNKSSTVSTTAPPPSVSSNSAEIDSTTETKTTEETKQNTSAWKQSLRNALREMKDIVKIRHHEKPIEPLLACQDEMFVKARLQLMFEETSFSVLNLQPKIYQESLKEINYFINRYFEESSEQVKKLSSEIQELSAINIKPEIPNLNRSLEQLSLLRKKK